MKKVLSIIFIICLGNIALSQNQLSLGDAIRIALENNYQIKINKLQTDVAKNNNTWGNAGKYPSLDLTLGQNNSITDQSNNPTSFIRDLIITNSIQPGISLNWTLFNGFAVSITKERLSQLELQSELNVNIVVENTIQSVILAYYNTKFQQQKLEILKQSLELSSDRYDYAKQREEVGVNSSFNTLQDLNNYYSDSINYKLQEIAAQNSLRNLCLIMAEVYNPNYLLSDSMKIIAQQYDYGSLKNKMLANNTNIRNQYINSKIYRQDALLAKARMYPVVSFNAGASSTSSFIRISDASSNAFNLNYYANFTVNFNLFNGKQTKIAIANAKIQEEIAQLNIEEAEQQLSIDLQNSYDLYNSRITIMNLLEKSVEYAKKNLDLAKLQYEGGAISSFDYRNVQISYLNAQDQLYEAKYNIIDTHTELMRLTGSIIEDNEVE